MEDINSQNIAEHRFEEDDESESVHAVVQGPSKPATELICFPHNTVSGECVAKDGSVTFTSDTLYERLDLTKITLDGTNINCKRDNGFSCLITFRLNQNRQT